jgi:hypothetical protein
VLLRVLLGLARWLGWAERAPLDVGALREARDAGVARVEWYPSGAIRRVVLLPAAPKIEAARVGGAGGGSALDDDPLFWSSRRRPGGRVGAGAR